jgi:PAS domain S-box-containing protein
MEELLDIRTIIFTLAFGNFVFGVVLILLQRREEQSLRNPFWIAAKFLQCTGWLLLAGRGTIADVFSYTLGNFCLISGFAYECWAMFRISNRPVPRGYQWAGLTYALLGILAATPLSATGRLAASTLLSAPVLVLLAWAIFRGGSSHSSLRTYMGASTLLLAVAASLRGIIALTSNGEFALFSQNPIQFISFFILLYMMLANGFGMLVLSKEQTDLRLQEVLKEQKAILDTLPTGLCILRDRMIVACNPAMEAIFGFAPDTLQGQSVRSLYENDEVFETYGRRIYREIAATGRFEGEVLYQRRNGERFWAKDHGRTIILGERPEAYTVFSIIYITEQKNQQDLLTRQKEELEATLARVKRLEGIISICMYCKKIRTEQESWEQLEKYITENSDALFSHGICPDCYARSLRDQI